MKTTPARISTCIPLFVLAALACAATACDRRSGDAPAKETETTGATQANPSIEQVKDSPARFYGKRVTLTGEVDSPKADAKTFTLEGNDWIFDHGIRVLARSPIKMGGKPLGEDEKVIVTGTVRPFVTAEIEREIGWDLAPELEVELREKPVLVAEEIRRIEPAASWTAKQPEGEVVGLFMLVSAPTPDVLAGQRITVDKAKVQSVSGKGLWIGPSHADQTFVMPTGGAELSGIKEGDMVDVRGTIKKTPPAAEAIKQFGLPDTMRGVVGAEPLYVEASEVKRAGGGRGAKDGNDGKQAKDGKDDGAKAKK